jgi:DNA-binding transcriptional MerR regulator
MDEDSEDPKDTPVFFLIGELAERMGVAPSTIRFYEGKGLIKPKRHGRLRVYSLANAERLLVLMELRARGVPVKKIRQLVEQSPEGVGLSASKAIKAVLKEQKCELLQMQEKVAAQLETIKKKLDAEQDGDSRLP